MLKVCSWFVVLLTFSTLVTAAVPLPQGNSKTKVTLKFNQTEYIHRWSQNGQNEFTPAGQENLEKWTDMVTIIFYPQASDGDSLARIANQVLENYKDTKGIILKTSSVPRTAERPAEHFIAAVLGRPTFLEAVQARFKLVDGNGVGIIYSHRIYGKEVGPQMSTWLKQNGPTLENVLMAWEWAPALSRLK
jgi:hypothetical protein